MVMKYKVGDSVFFVESQRKVRTGVVIGIAGGRYTVKLGYESAIRLPEIRYNKLRKLKTA
ncbi:hypothetical protein [Hominenteromicrobium sp.]|uniref:hypothetical protein n=1 Tax=Hominenteromicrobium sp. TaxID=3073581 RepID=UPI003A9477E3